VDQRQHDRIPLEEEGWRAELLDQVSGNKLGEVVNLSQGGLMMITPLAVEPDSLYQVELRASGPDGQQERFSAGMMVLWRSEAGRPNAYWAGLQIIDIDAAAEAKLRALTAALTATS
jgi:hypothetical protein